MTIAGQRAAIELGERGLGTQSDELLGQCSGALTKRFGKPRIHSLVNYRHAEYPEVSWLTNVDKEGNVDWYGVKRATDWHTDSTFENALPLLFKPFYRVDDSRGTTTGGMGLGLAIVRNALAVHGGTAVARNVSPHGLEVELRLPLTPDPAGRRSSEFRTAALSS